MKIPLSPRLSACAEFVEPGARVADVGCDHGYLSIYLLSNNIASYIYASDINEMPLQSARQNANKFNIENKIAFFLSNGLISVPQNFDTLICAGMGADTIVSIISAAPWLKSTKYSLILQCQSKTPTLRKYLSDNGWYITREKVLKDGKFLYTIMLVRWNPERSHLSDAECYFPPILKNNKNQETYEYLRWVMNGIRIQAEYQHDPEKAKIYSQLKSINLEDF